MNYDYLIVGAGPAGLQLGYYFQNSGSSYLILESGSSSGSSFKSFPRHRKLISINKVHTGYSDFETNLRWDWNSLLSENGEHVFKDYSESYFPSADDLVNYLGGFAERYELNIQYNVDIKSISKNGVFTLLDSKGNEYTCNHLIVATGLSKPYMPAIPGLELTENYADVSVDANDFKNQKVLVIGKGNSGFETADNLISTAAVIHVISPNPLTFAWKSHYVGHLRAINNNFLDTYQLKSQNAVLDATIQKIEKSGDKYIVSVIYSHANGETEDLIYDRVISCMGFKFDNSIFAESCRPQLAINDRFPAQTSAWESTNIEGLYFAGVLMQMRDIKKSTSGFIHGFRYNVRVLHKILEYKNHKKPFDYASITTSAEALASSVIKRVNQTSALWQQFGFLCDILVVTGKETKWYQEFPLDFVHDGSFGDLKDYFILTLEFGKVNGDPFAIDRCPMPEMAKESVFLHPVVRHFRNSEKVGEIHLLEDLDAVWDRELTHIEPMRDFFRKELDLMDLSHFTMRGRHEIEEHV